MIKFSFLKKRKLFKISCLLLFLFFILCLALNPEKYTKSTYSGIVLWAVCVLPSLLPYFFLTAFLTKSGDLNSIFYKLTPITKKLFRLNGISSYAYFMSILSGYPVGSKIVSDLFAQNLITKSGATRLSILASTSGPLFIIGAVGVSMFQSKTVGFIMYLTHILSSFLTALIFRNYGDSERLNPSLLSSETCDNILYECVYSSVISALVVGGFVSIFYVLSEILLDFKLLYPLECVFKFLLMPLSSSNLEAKAVAAGIIEFTKGASMLCKISITPLTISLTNFLITFGGVSVITQSLAFLKKAQVNAFVFIFAKLMSAVICFVICYLCCLFFL